MCQSQVKDFLDHKFTHLIIGGGTAGLVVAARLSETPSITVGVLEAGSPAFDEQRINVPGRFGETLGTEYDWRFETTPQEGINGKVLPWPRGKVLGGTSALNFMTWNRGCREDYDAWEELGNEGWGWEGMLPFFKKSEHFHPPHTDHQAQHHSHFDPDFHGTDGPLQTAYSLEYGASHQHWHSTFHKLGVPTNRSHLSGSNVGVWTSLGSVDPRSRQRSYSATAYYRPVSGRKNLVLLTDAIAREIILEEKEGRWIAEGVKFVHRGVEHTVKASSEVVVCAGSVQSPQLLELSGIGNPDVLRAAGICVKIENMNVGENLQDHMMTAMVFEIDPSIETPDDLRADSALAAAADCKYASSRSGPRTIIPSSVAYLPFSHYVPAKDLSDITSSLFTGSSATTSLRDGILARRFLQDQGLGQIEFNFDVSNYSPYFSSLKGKKYATMLLMLQYPFSKGSVHIPPMKDGKPSTSDNKPIINPKYCSGKDGQIDFRMMVAAQKFADKICRTKPLADIIVSRVFPPARADNVGESEEDFTDWVRDTTITDWHPVGTCSMGPSGEEYVVDGRLRVHGVSGLRVVDASIIPLQVSAHIQSTVYAIGEKAASMISEDWEK